MIRFYVATRLERAAEAAALAADLKSRGMVHSYDWTAHGSVQNDGPARIREVAHAETYGVISADVVIVLLPGGRGTHTELGIALAATIARPADRLLVLVGDDMTDGRTCAFYWHELVRHAATVDDAIGLVVEWANERARAGLDEPGHAGGGPEPVRFRSELLAENGPIRLEPVDAAGRISVALLDPKFRTDAEQVASLARGLRNSSSDLPSAHDVEARRSIVAVDALPDPECPPDARLIPCTGMHPCARHRREPQS